MRMGRKGIESKMDKKRRNSEKKERRKVVMKKRRKIIRKEEKLRKRKDILMRIREIRLKGGRGGEEKKLWKGTNR